jgi:hypothetical protein
MFKKCIAIGLITCAWTPCFSSPLHQAVRAHDIVSLESLLESHVGDDVNATIGNGVTPLHLAAATDQADMATLLIERGATISATNNLGFTAFHWAASRNNINTMNVLIEAGADLNAKARNGITPLHWAASKNAVVAVTRLINANADISAKTAMGYTPLHLAVKHDPYCEAAVLLAQARARQTETDDASTALATIPTPVELTHDGSNGTNALPEGVQQPEPIVPGMYLSVPIGLGDALSFVWMPETGIWFGKHEISNSLYRRFDPLHSSRRVEGISLDDPNQPAVYVSWNDAMAYCAWLTTNFSDRIPEHYVFRLPTEAEWMLAAGAGTLRVYPWGDEWPPTYGNFPDQTSRDTLADWRGFESYNDGYAITAPVDATGMNELGIFGLAGNVWEWTLDWLDDTQKEYKIRKGGSWDFDSQDSLRINARGLDRPTARYDTIGFRIVVAPYIQPKD